MNNQQIKDIASLKKIQEDAKMLYHFKKAWPFIKPILKTLKVDVNSIENDLQHFPYPIKKAQEIIEIPDKFNNFFSSNGWIIYDLMDFDIAQNAINLAEIGRIEKAEELLVEYYSPNNIEKFLKYMEAIKSFRPRMELIKFALEDYKQGRYYSTVLIILSILDGMVNEIHRHGFFSEASELTAWDSISAHDKGLQKLKNLFFKTRNKTTTEKLTIPYRNGILHGMDLGYNNKIVASKCWAALFATRDWAIKAERNELQKPPPKPKQKSFKLLSMFSEYQAEKVAIDQWLPRKIDIGIDLPESGLPNEYPDNTPEKVVANFLYYWEKANYGFMAELCSKYLSKDFPVKPIVIRNEYENKKLYSWKFLNINDISAGFCNIELEIGYKECGNSFSKKSEARVIHECEDGTFIVRQTNSSHWALVNYHLV